MFRWILASTLLLPLLASPEGQTQGVPTPPESQPTSRPVDGDTLRSPRQAEILKDLLRRADRPTPIQPRSDEPRSPAEAGVGADGRPLLLEGTTLVERPGRLAHEDGQARFLFHLEGDEGAARSMQLLPCQLLETMEREAQSGFDEFIVTAEVTRYKGENFLLLRKVLRRTGHGNLSP